MQHLVFNCYYYFLGLFEVTCFSGIPPDQARYPNENCMLFLLPNQ